MVFQNFSYFNDKGGVCVNKERFFETMDELKYAIDNADYKLRRLLFGYFMAQRYGKTLMTARLVTLINGLQDELEQFQREDYDDMEELSL